MQEAGKERAEGRQHLRAQGQEEGEGGGGWNSSQILSSTKIVPATWQESVQTSQIQEPCPFPRSYNSTKEPVGERHGPKDPLADVPSIRGALKPQSIVY